MEKQFNIAIQNRRLIQTILKRTPPEMLFKIPEGFRNNIWWNIAHIVATQQILLYRWSGLPNRINDNWVDRYKKGTKPNMEPTEAEIDQLSDYLINTVNWAEDDFRNGVFETYQEYTTSVKVTLSSVEDAINFNNYHEGIHLGVVLSQLKALGVSVF